MSGRAGALLTTSLDFDNRGCEGAEGTESENRKQNSGVRIRIIELKFIALLNCLSKKLLSGGASVSGILFLIPQLLS
jgi:hypothetical protein